MLTQSNASLPAIPSQKLPQDDSSSSFADNNSNRPIDVITLGTPERVFDDDSDTVLMVVAPCAQNNTLKLRKGSFICPSLPILIKHRDPVTGLTYWPSRRIASAIAGLAKAEEGVVVWKLDNDIPEWAPTVYLRAPFHMCDLDSTEFATYEEKQSRITEKRLRGRYYAPAATRPPSTELPFCDSASPSVSPQRSTLPFPSSPSASPEANLPSPQQSPLPLLDVDRRPRKSLTGRLKKAFSHTLLRIPTTRHAGLRSAPPTSPMPSDLPPSPRTLPQFSYHSFVDF